MKSLKGGDLLKKTEDQIGKTLDCCSTLKKIGEKNV